jgi:glycosyltransferase involved in cell wall biosynthesis
MRVQVLLSTYNGADFLPAQLESLLRQQDVEVSILIRDDGSRDDTIAIIRKYMRAYPRIALIEGENIGVVPSYFALLNAADVECDLFAFCDQDDIWLPDKLTTAARLLAGHAGAAAFASPVWLTDDGERRLGCTPVPHKPLSLGNALVQNRLIGCTVVFNAAALRLIQQHPPDLAGVYMHDWWVYLTASAFGAVVFHDVPTVLYRQHAANVVGMKSDGLAARLARFRKNERRCSLQARAFLDAFGSRLSAEQRTLVERVAADKPFGQRLALALDRRVYRQRWIDDLLFRVLLLLDRV